MGYIPLPENVVSKVTRVQNIGSTSLTAMRPP